MFNLHVGEDEINGDDILAIHTDFSTVYLNSEQAVELCIYLLDNFPGMTESLENYAVYVSS